MSLQRQVIAPPQSTLDAGRSAGRALSQIVRGGDFLFVSGLTAIDPQTGARVHATTQVETRVIITNLAAMLEAAGSSLAKVVKVNVLLHSMLEAPNMEGVYATFFADAPPARTVCGAKLPDGVKVMIECTALA